MGSTVPRHGFPAENAENRAQLLDKSASRRIDSLEQSPQNFNLALGTSLLAAQTHCGSDPRAADLPTWEAWVTAMQVGSAVFRSAVITEGFVECRISNQVRAIPATGPQTYSDAGNWLTAFWLAIICRERGRLAELAEVPIALMRASGTVHAEYVYAWIDALQKWLREGGDLSDPLSAAMAGTDPNALPVGDQDLVLKIQYPPINLFIQYITQEPEQFNEALIDALNWHKDYWTEDEERFNSSSGLVALGPLAMACLAYDADFPITVESEYLPKHLLQRGWLGEFPT